MSERHDAAHAVLDLEGLGRLLAHLREAGRQLVGPTVRDGAIVFDRVAGLDDLPRGVGVVQDAGRYRLVDRGDAAHFGYTTGPGSLKRWFFPPRETLWRAVRPDGGGLRLEPTFEPPPPLAVIGARACDLAALAIHDRVFAGAPNPDPRYVARRRDVFVVALQCAQPAPPCFCTSMGTGPRAESGFDLALTELLEHDGTPRYVVEVGSERGRAVLAALGAPAADEPTCARARAHSERCARAITRRVRTRDLPARLLAQLEHPRWDEVADRCLACGNCTLVCPTCFCFEVHDRTDLVDGESRQERVWDSCFSLAHSTMHGRPVRAERRARYRQWLTHKFATWHAQFGTSGCVGCGRCIAWCPVGIDVTEELEAIAGAPEPTP